MKIRGYWQRVKELNKARAEFNSDYWLINLIISFFSLMFSMFIALCGFVFYQVGKKIEEDEKKKRENR